VTRTGIAPDPILAKECTVGLYQRPRSSVEAESIERSRFDYSSAIHEAGGGLEAGIE
jgi:hypothetical protein